MSDLKSAVIEVCINGDAVHVTVGGRNCPTTDLLAAAAQVAVDCFRGRAGAVPCAGSCCRSACPPARPGAQTSDGGGC